MTTTLRLTLALALGVAVSACDSGGMTEPPPPPPGPSNTTIRFDFNYVEAVKDCDGFPLGEGEFDLIVSASPSFASGSTVLSSSERGLDDGERTGALGRREWTTEGTSGKQVNITFRSSEIDYDLFGAPFDDSRMSNRAETRTHTFNGTAWGGLGPRSITMGSGDCQVRLSYNVSQI